LTFGLKIISRLFLLLVVLQENPQIILGNPSNCIAQASILCCYFLIVPGTCQAIFGQRADLVSYQSTSKVKEIFLGRLTVKQSSL